MTGPDSQSHTVMAQSPQPQSLQGLDHWVFSQGWGWARHSDSTSPASSSDSSVSCPCYATRPPSQSTGPARSARNTQVAPNAPRRARPAPAGGQRQSASEREKLRMRTLARALQELRRFLPPSVAPAGQSLTKIETLRLAIRYIGHLSAVLGLSEDSLRQQRHAVSPRGCPLCPDSGLAQAQSLGPHLSPVACSGVSWGSSPAYPRPRVAAESWDPSFLYTETASLERQEMEPSPSSPVSNPFPMLSRWRPLLLVRDTQPQVADQPLSLHAGSPLRASLHARKGWEGVDRQGLRTHYEEWMSADLAPGQVLIVALFILVALQQRHAGSARNLDTSGVAASLKS